MQNPTAATRAATGLDAGRPLDCSAVRVRRPRNPADSRRRCARGASSPALLALALCLATGLGAPSRAGAERWALTEFALGTSAAVCNLVYGPVKVAFALMGTVTGSLAWVLSGGDNDVARKIFQPSLRGDYMIRTENLTGDEPLHFYGRDPREQGDYW